MAQITMPDLGRWMVPGELYDVRTDTSMGTTLWPDTVIREHSSAETGKTAEFKFEVAESTTAVAKFFHIDADLKLSLLADLGSLGGRGSFLKENSSSTSKSGLSIVGRKVIKRCFIRYDEIRGQEKQDALKMGATHVVTEIWRGGNFVCTCNEEDSYHDNTIKGCGNASGQVSPASLIPQGGAFKSLIKRIVGELNTTGELSTNHHQSLQSRNISFEFFSNGINIGTLDTLSEVLTAMARGITSNDNGNDDVPVFVIMQPLHKVVDDISTTYFRLSEAVDDVISNRIMNQFHHLSQIQEEWVRLCSSINHHKEIVSALANECNQHITSVNAFIVKQFQELRRNITNYRTNGDMKTVLENLTVQDGECKSTADELDGVNKRWLLIHQVIKEVANLGFPFVPLSNIGFSWKGMICAVPETFSAERMFRVFEQMKLLKGRPGTTQFVSVYLDSTSQYNHTISRIYVKDICILERDSNGGWSSVSATPTSPPNPQLRMMEFNTEILKMKIPSTFQPIFPILDSIVSFLHRIHINDLSAACYDVLVPDITPIWYQKRKPKDNTPDWQWSPGNDVWIPVTNMIVPRGRWAGSKPAHPNRLIILYLQGFGTCNQQNVQIEVIQERFVKGWLHISELF